MPGLNPMSMDIASLALENSASPLTGFLPPMLLADVFSAMRERRLLHAPADVGGHAALPFGWGDLESLLMRDASNAGDYRFFKNGKAVKPAALGLVDGRGALHAQALSRVIEQGITIVGNRLEHKVPAFWPLLCDLQRHTGASVGLAFVASFECPKALPVHYDYPDNIVIQTEGSKRWRLYGEPIAGSGCQRTLEHTPDNLVQEIELSRGDLMFVPSGLHHLCSSEQDSLHLGMLIEWPTGLELLKRATKLAGDDEAVCEPLRRIADEASLRATEKHIKDRLHALIDAIDTRALLDELAGKMSRAERLKLPRRGCGDH